MLIQFNNNALINLESIQYLYIKNGSLVCVVPSAENQSGYQEVYLGVSGTAAILAIKEIAKVYKQYIITNQNTIIIPPKVIQLQRNTTYLSGSDVIHGQANWQSQKLMTGNRLYMDVPILNKNTGAQLYEGRDFSVEYPLYKGDGVVHCIDYKFPQSNTHYTYLFYASLKAVHKS